MPTVIEERRGHPQGAPLRRDVSWQQREHPQGRPYGTLRQGAGVISAKRVEDDEHDVEGLDSLPAG